MVGMAMGAATSSAHGRWRGPPPASPWPCWVSSGWSRRLLPDLWSGLFTTDPAVRAAANLYLRWAGPGFAFVGLGLSLYFASQGSGKVLTPVLAGTVRLWVILAGGLWLAASAAPVWAFSRSSAGP